MFHTFLDIMKIGDRDKDKVVDALYDSWLLPLRSTLFSFFIAKERVMDIWHLMVGPSHLLLHIY
jgi:hypothetical protein